MSDKTIQTTTEGRSFERPVQRVYCSFCGADQTEVRVMVAGHWAAICDICTGVAEQVVSTHGAVSGEAEYTSWIESLNSQIDGPQGPAHR